MLAVAHLQAAYGDSRVLFDVSFEVGAGEVVTLLGRNGMGKTTTINAIMGLVRPTGGAVTFHGRTVSGLPTYEIAQRGIGLVPEGRQVFPTLTVDENLIATSAARAGARRWTLEGVYALFPSLRERRRHLGSQLSGGEQQMLAIGRALMTNPELLILDEPSDGLAPNLVAEVMDLLDRLRAGGMSVLLVEQDLAAALSVCDRGYVMEKGAIVFQGSSAELRDSPVTREKLGV